MLVDLSSHLNDEFDSWVEQFLQKKKRKERPSLW